MSSSALFDNRYRYDYIYPRGRSGETLRAEDTQDNNRPVVIKRPAPQDAPPLRAAQEVSILIEKKALERLSGHPVLTELRGSGIFRAGGNPYQYIVMDRAEGEIVETMVLDHPNDPLSELEMLIIVDRLLDLLTEAHNQRVIYNDVDAKHLFWNRDTYRLKVIDWGNAVFTDEAGAPPNITQANDIYQVGELLYFLYSKGTRLASETTADGEYIVHFKESVPEAIQDIITRATHPNIKTRRFVTIRALREALTKYRQPLERERDLLVESAKKQLNDHSNQQTLRELEAQLDDALVLDPGYPEARRLKRDIQTRLRYLAVQADFEAVQIYLEAGNWSRAIHLMEEMIPNADQYMASLLTFLIAAAEQLQNRNLAALPQDFDLVISTLQEGKTQQAALILIDPIYTDQREERMLIAERLATLLPGVIVLRPHLVRLACELRPHSERLERQIEQIRSSINADLEAGILPVLDRYSKVAIQLNDLLPDLETTAASVGLSLEIFTQPVEHAESAVRAIIQHVRRIGETFYTSPTAAETALKQAQQIDPSSEPLEHLPTYLNEAHTALQQIGSFRPAGDQAALENWFQDAQIAMEPYERGITDPGFMRVWRVLDDLQAGWQAIGELLILGRQRQTLDQLKHMTEAVRAFNTHVADWFDNTARLIKEGAVIEKFARNEPVSRALVEGYAAWDQGKSGKAADFARRAEPSIQTEAETLAVERLRRLAEITNEWLNGGNVTDPTLTRQIESDLFTIFLPDEKAEYERFSQQMKSEEVYLKAMKLGIVSSMRGSSSAALRILFFHYVLQGVLALQEDKLEDADFWREAAISTYQHWQTHPVFTAFDGALTRRKLVLRAEAALNELNSFEAIPRTRQVLNAPLAEDWLKDAQQALVQIETARGNFADGDFRAAREAFDKALEGIDAAEKVGGMQLKPLRHWLQPYRDSAAQLVERRQIVEQAAMAASLDPDPKVQKALEEIVRLSEETMGSESARQVRLWNSLYQTMLKTHQNRSQSKREKIAEFDINFAALFIDKHPAYRLFRRWYDAARALPDDVQEELQMYVDDGSFTESGGREAVAIDEEALDSPSFESYDDLADPYAEDRTSFNWNWVIGITLVILLGMGAFAVYQFATQGNEPVRRFQATPTLAALLSAVERTETARAQITPTEIVSTEAAAVPSSPTIVRPVSATPSPTETVEELPTSTLTPTEAVTIVTNTPPPTLTLVPTATTAVLLPDAEVDALRVLNLIQPEDYGWDAAFFSEGAGGIWQLGASVEDAGTAPIAVIISPEFMEAFNPDTASRLQRAEVTMGLTFYDETRIESGQVYFGLAIQNQARQRYGAQVQLESDGLVSLGVNENGTFRSRSALPVSRVRVTLTLQRNTAGTVSFFIDGQRVGDSPALFPPGEPVSLVLYNAGGGMFVTVSSFTLELAPFIPEE